MEDGKEPKQGANSGLHVFDYRLPLPSPENGGQFGGTMLWAARQLGLGRRRLGNLAAMDRCRRLRRPSTTRMRRVPRMRTEIRDDLGFGNAARLDPPI